MNQELGSIKIKVNLNHGDHDINEDQFAILCNIIDQTMQMVELAAWGLMQHNFSVIPPELANVINYSFYNDVTSEYLRQHGTGDAGLVMGNYHKEV